MKPGIAVFAAGTLLTSLTLTSDRNTPDAADPVSVWTTTADQRLLLAEQPGTGLGTATLAQYSRIDVDPGTRYQPVQGFGASITESAAQLLDTHPERDELMRELFDPGGIGLSALRQPIGASDFVTGPHFTYADDRADASSLDLSRDERTLRLLRQARELAPELWIMASPWTAPSWMKTNNALIGGQLRTDAHQDYADYLTAFARHYADAGVPVQAITPQNEPQKTDPEDYPGMAMPVEQQAALVPRLARTLDAAGLDTRILGYDHNWAPHANDTARDDYPERLLSTAGEHLAGTAFHCYAGVAERQARLHDRFPGKQIHLSECSPVQTGDTTFRDTLLWQTENLIIDGMRNWSRSVLLWNLALDPRHGPHNGGCTDCDGVLELDPATGSVHREAGYYTLAHASKFVRPGARRIASTAQHDEVRTVAFQNPDGGLALIALNTGAHTRTVRVTQGGRGFDYPLPGASVSTFTWRPV